MPKTPRSSKTRCQETLNSLLKAYSPDSAALIVDQYEEQMQALLENLRSAGFSADKLRKRLATALRNKDTGGYVNHACELAVASHFLEKFPDGFRYQVPSAEPTDDTGTPKNFDFSFIAKGVTFNVEVKSLTPKASDRVGPPVKQFLPQSQAQVLHKQGARFSMNCKPAIGRHLEDSNNQLTRPAHGLSVMVLCCNDLAGC